MFRNAIESYTGYLQVQHQDFWDTKTIDNVFPYENGIDSIISSDDNVSAIIPRFESFALVSSGSLTKGVLVMGIDPEKEVFLSDINAKLVRFSLTDENLVNIKAALPPKYRSKIDFFSGKAYSSGSSFLADIGAADNDSTIVMDVMRKYASFSNGQISKGQPGVLIGSRLSLFLEASIGDTLVLLGQGYHGTTAAGKYPVKGIVKMPTPDLDNQIVFMPLEICQELYNAQGLLTSLVIAVKKNDDNEINRMISSLGTKVQPPLRIIGWREMNELMINQMTADSKSGMVMIAILYLVIAFGIFGTVLMMTAERRREFGVLVALGLQKTKLASVVAFEMMYIGLMGVFCGSAAALPVIFYGYYHPLRFSGQMGRMYEDYGMEPVMPFMPVDWYFLWQSVVIVIIVAIAIIYPVRKILRIEVVKALKGSL
jgi:ABC-type lipoprotein release transport system permease subunit